MKLSSRMALAMVALVVLTALAIGLLSYRNIRSAVLPRAAERSELHVRMLATALTAAVRGAREDISGFQDAVAIAGIVRAHLAGGTDPQDGTSEAVWRRRMAERFAAELGAKPSYDIFRVIAFGDGRELVRVDRQGANNAIRIVPDDELKTKTDQRFFVEAKGGPANAVYVSPLELSLGNSRADRIPILRVAAIIQTPDQKPFGMVVINVDMRSILHELAGSQQPGGKIYVVDDRGNYVLHPDPSRQFAVDSGKGSRWQNDFPALAPFFSSDDVKSALIDGDQDEKSLADMAAAVLAGGPRVAVMEVTPLSAIMTSVAAVGRSTLLVGIVSVLCAAALAVLLARSLTRPLVQITNAVEAFPDGSLIGETLTETSMPLPFFRSLTVS